MVFISNSLFNQINTKIPKLWVKRVQMVKNYEISVPFIFKEYDSFLDVTEYLVTSFNVNL